MKNHGFSRYLLSVVLAMGGARAMAAGEPVYPEQVVSAMEEVFGVTPGERRNHIKGTCASGSFVGAPEAAALSRSALFSGAEVPVVARFSLAGGNPEAPDAGKTARGMALEFRLPGHSLQHITMIDTPVFGAAQPGTFLDMLRALKPDPKTGQPDPAKLNAFRASHPDSLAQAAFLASHNPPESYTTSAYWGIHTFWFTNREDRKTAVRWQFVPRDGEKRLSDEELRTAPTDFLEDRLEERLGKGPVQWDMVVTIGQAGDTEDNPTVEWPADRRRVTVGTLTIAAVQTEEGAPCENINFDPLVMADGIAPGKDPVLLFRSPAYMVSFAKRMSGL